MKNTPQFVRLASLILLALCAHLAVGQTQIGREGNAWGQTITGSLGAAKNLHVRVDMGSVTVHGGAQNITYVIHSRSYTSSEQDARHQFDSYKISSYVRGDTAWIVGEWEGRHPHHFSGDFTISVPRNMELVKIETEGGSVDATAIAGRVEAESGGGGIHVDDIGNGLRAETGGGSIDVGTASGDLSLHTGGGSIHVHHANGRVTAETGGGSIEIQSGAQDANVETGGGSVSVRQCNGRVKASTGGGSIDLGDIGGPADIETGGGNIKLVSAKGPVRAETGGGGIELYGIPSAHAETGAGGITVKLVNTGGERTDSVLETSAGDITVYIAPDVAVSIRANVDLGNGHQITSDFSDIHISSEGGQWGPKTLSAQGNLNGGGPMLKVRTTTGNIYFKRANQ